MTFRKTICATVTVLAALLCASPARAQIFRAYLASTGNDANPCTLAAPCRLLPAALAAAASGGEIWMLDSANYNTATVTIGKSVSILAVPGAVGSIVATGGPAISISASSLTVALRNVVIVPLPGAGGTDGVSMTGASALTIENSLVANLPNHGVNVTGTGVLKITDTTIRNNGNVGVYLQDGADADVFGTKMLGNGNGGIYAYTTIAATTTASVSDSLISGGYEGVIAYTGNVAATSKIFVTRCTIKGTTYALNSATGGTGSSLVVVGSSMVTNNSFGWSQSGTGSVIRSLGNNDISDNNSTAGSLTPMSPL
jgi:hypothetical protein